MPSAEPSATRHSPSRPSTAEVLQVINGSPSDLEPVFQAIVKKGAHAVQRRLWQFAAVGWREVPWRRDARFFGSNGRRAAAGLHPGIQSPVPTLAGRRAYRSLPRFGANRRSSDWRPRGRAQWRRNYPFCGATQRGRFARQIVAARREVRPFTKSEIALVENLAGARLNNRIKADGLKASDVGPAR